MRLNQMYRIYSKAKLLIIIILQISVFISIIASEQIQNIDIIELDKYDRVAGPVVYFGAIKSDQWIIYEKLKINYSNQELEKFYYSTESLVVKVYLYWALREKGFTDIDVIKNDILEYGDEQLEYVSYGCIIEHAYLKDIIEDRLEYYLEDEFKNREITKPNPNDKNPLLDD